MQIEDGDFDFHSNMLVSMTFHSVQLQMTTNDSKCYKIFFISAADKLCFFLLL